MQKRRRLLLEDLETSEEGEALHYRKTTTNTAEILWWVNIRVCAAGCWVLTDQARSTGTGLERFETGGQLDGVCASECVDMNF